MIFVFVSAHEHVKDVHPNRSPKKSSKMLELNKLQTERESFRYVQFIMRI